MGWQQEYVLQTIEDKGIRSVRLWLTDVVGWLKSVAIAPVGLEEAFEEGIGSDGSSIQGMTCVHRGDIAVRPDTRTFLILPWRDEDAPMAQTFRDALIRDDEPVRSGSRPTLRRTLGKTTDVDFSYFIHPEIEFCLFHPEDDLNREPVPIGDSFYFDYVTRSPMQGFRRDAILILGDMSISVEFSHHEAGPGQNKIDLQSTDALKMTDNVMTLRTVVEQIAIEQGVHTFFMPKPLVNSSGNGIHTYFLLFEEDRSAFYDAAGPGGLPRTGQKFIAGFLRHAREIMAMTNQRINSYKRLYSGDRAPSYVYWESYGRSTLVRMSTRSPSKP